MRNIFNIFLKEKNFGITYPNFTTITIIKCIIYKYRFQNTKTDVWFYQVGKKKIFVRKLIIPKLSDFLCLARRSQSNPIHCKEIATYPSGATCNESKKRDFLGRIAQFWRC
jgi:hypothetical protein